MQTERLPGRLRHGRVVTQGGERERQVETGRRPRRRRVAPQAETLIGESWPGKQRAWIGLAPRRDVGVSDEIGRWKMVALTQIRQQGEQRIDLRVREGLVAIVVEFDAKRRLIDVGVPAPPGFPGVPGPGILFDQLDDPAVVTDQVVRADLAHRRG